MKNGALEGSEPGLHPPAETVVGAPLEPDR